MNKLIKTALAAAVAGAAFSSHATLVIDDFNIDTPKDPVVSALPALWDADADGVGKSVSVSGPTSSIFGGQRDMYVEKISGGDGIISAKVVNGQYSYSTDNGNPLLVGKGYIKWDGNNGSNGVGSLTSQNQAGFLSTVNATGLGGANFWLHGDAFKIKVVNSDLGFDFAITVWSSATDWTTLVLQSVSHLNGAPDSSPIMFADFQGTGGCVGPSPIPGFCSLGPGKGFKMTGGAGANLSSVGAILADINFSGGSKEIDLSLDSVNVVPEPSSLALAGLALVGLGAIRRRKQQA